MGWSATSEAVPMALIGYGQNSQNVLTFLIHPASKSPTLASEIFLFLTIAIYP
jgi:hypothetical protein